jgi:hypothetical protein
MTEASANLDAPESAPAAPIESAPAARMTRTTTASREGERGKDGRSARRTGRTVQFATRVSAEFDDRLREIAQREGLLLVEVLELALDAYETRSRDQKGVTS